MVCLAAVHPEGAFSSLLVEVNSLLTTSRSSSNTMFPQLIIITRQANITPQSTVPRDYLIWAFPGSLRTSMVPSYRRPKSSPQNSLTMEIWTAVTRLAWVSWRAYHGPSNLEYSQTLTIHRLGSSDNWRRWEEQLGHRIPRRSIHQPAQPSCSHQRPGNETSPDGYG